MPFCVALAHEPGVIATPCLSPMVSRRTQPGLFVRCIGDLARERDCESGSNFRRWGPTRIALSRGCYSAPVGTSSAEPRDCVGMYLRKEDRIDEYTPNADLDETYVIFIWQKSHPVSESLRSFPPSVPTTHPSSAPSTTLPQLRAVAAFIARAV